jgi:heptosyltransferase-3
VLTLPLAAILKEHFPDTKIAFMGKSYTKAVIEACEYVDLFIDVDDFLKQEVLIEGIKPECIIHVFPLKEIAARAKQLGIPLRIGTTNRLYHWTTCNKLVRLSRKNSNLHEAQLNTKLLQPLGISKDYSKEELANLTGLTRLPALDNKFGQLIDPCKYNLILHPKSQGSAREWGLDNFRELIRTLDKDKVKIFISGTEKERELLQPLLDQVGDQVIDITGRMDLGNFISFIAGCDGLVANSTGPLHIAAAVGRDTFGIYPPLRPIHPGRWAPLGPRAQIFVMDKTCSDCRNDPHACLCIKQVSPALLKKAIEASASRLQYSADNS